MEENMFKIYDKVRIKNPEVLDTFDTGQMFHYTSLTNGVINDKISDYRYHVNFDCVTSIPSIPDTVTLTIHEMDLELDI